MESLERVLNAACTMYTTHDNLEHTIKLQEQLFRQRLRLRGIALDDDEQKTNPNGNESSSSEHLYDNIDDETSEMEKTSTVAKTRLIATQTKKSSTHCQLSTDEDEQEQKNQLTKHQKVRFLDQYHSYGKRKNYKSTSRTNLAKPNHLKRNSTQKKLPLPLPSTMLTVTIT